MPTFANDHLDHLDAAMKRFADSGWANLGFDDTVTPANTNRVEQDDRFYLLALAVQAVAIELRALRHSFIPTAPKPLPIPARAAPLSAEQLWVLSLMQTEVAIKQHAVLHVVDGRFQLLFDGVNNTAVSDGEFVQLAGLGLIYCQDLHWFTSEAGRQALRMHGMTL